MAVPFIAMFNAILAIGVGAGIRAVTVGPAIMPLLLDAVLAQITSLIADKGFNIAQQLNTSKGDIAYNVIDLDDFPKDSTENLQKELLAMDGVLSTRFIFTGSVAEGPAAFYVKDVSVCG